MQNHAEKSRESRIRAVGNQLAPTTSGGTVAFQLVDNRPDAAQLRKLQGMADHSPQAKAAAQFQAMAHGSPPMVAQRQQLERLLGPAAQRQEAPEEELLMKSKAAPVQKQGLEEEEPLQGEFIKDAAPAHLQSEAAPKVNNTGLPENLKVGVEDLSGVSLDNVNVHYNSAKPAQLQALAYTQGSDIHVGTGQERHLPHEAWHVVQQRQGRVKPTMQTAGAPVNDDVGLEKEAELMGRKALSSGSSVLENKASLSMNRDVNSAPKQLMVAVAGGQATFNKKDFTQLAHLDWAMKISGGPLVDLDASIRKVGVDEDLHLVQHGGKGVMVHQIDDTQQWKAISAKPIADLFIKYLPKNYAGRIRVSSCYSGTVTDISDQDSSLVKQIKAQILASPRKDLHGVWIVGWDGPTITNINLNSDSGTGAETVDDAKVSLAGKIQNGLLAGKYKKLKEDWEKKVGADTRGLDELASAASKEFSGFYQEFTDLCKKDKLLLDYVDSLVIA